MSLVNQMLQDLERRQAGGVVAGSGEVLTELSATRMPPARAGGFRGIYGLILVLAIGLWMGAIWRGGAPLEITWPWQLGPVPVSIRSESTPVPKPVVLRAVASVPAKIEVAPVEAVKSPKPVQVLSPMPTRQHRLRLAHSLTRTPKPASPTAVVREVAAVSVAAVARPIPLPVETSQRNALPEKQLKSPAAKLASRLPASTQIPALIKGPQPAVVTTQSEAVPEKPAKSGAIKTNSGVPAPRQQAKKRATRLIKTLVPLSPQEQAEREFSRARELLRAGAGERGNVGLRTALALYPGHIDARELLAARLASNGDLSGAEKLLEGGLRAVPGEPRFAAMWARLLVEQGELLRALEILKLASPPVAGNEQYHALHAAVLQRAGHHREVVEVYRALLLSRPASGTWWMGLGLSLEALGESAQARYAYAKAQGSGSLKGKVLQFVEQKLAVAP